ncbi:MAG: hypothetical protein ACI3W7_06815 [Oscillospiraceae bacterium]
MKYDLTEKLHFGADPKLVIRGTELTIRSDAEAVLKLMDVLGEKGEVAGAREAMALLLSKADQNKLAALNLKLDDWLEVLKAAIQLAMGTDPEDNTPGE